MGFKRLIAQLFNLEVPVPSDIVPRESIHVMQNPTGVLINLSKTNLPLKEPPKIWIPEIPATRSMMPVFHYGHYNILIQGSTDEDHAALIDSLQVGDIAVFRMMANPEDDPRDFTKPHYNGGYLIHRIAKISVDDEGKVFRFRGDNNWINDPWKVRPRNILWVYCGTIP